MIDIVQLAVVSSIDVVCQTIHSTNKQNGHAPIKKEVSICPSFLCLDLVTFSVLCQIPPQTPLLVVPFRQFLLSFSLATILSPEPTDIDFSERAGGIMKQTTPDLWSVWFMVKTTTVSDRLRSPTFVLDQWKSPWKQVLTRCFLVLHEETR